jgi:hypothetical protein
MCTLISRDTGIAGRGMLKQEEIRCFHFAVEVVRYSVTILYQKTGFSDYSMGQTLFATQLQNGATACGE